MINIGADEIKNKFKRFAKSGLKKVAIIVAPVAIVAIILAGVTWVIFDEAGKWENNERGRPSTYYNNTRVDPNEGIVSSTSREITNQGLADLGYSSEEIQNMSDEEIIEVLDISKKLKKNVTNIDDCTQAEILWCLSDEYAKYMTKPEELEYLLEAQLVTQYPKLDSISDDNKINGTIEFVRVAKESEESQETKTKLTYILQEEFEEKYNKYAETGNKEVFNYYTINNEGDVIVATYTEEKREFATNNTAKQTDRKKIRTGHDITSIRNKYAFQYEITTDTTDLIKASVTSYIPVKKKIPYKEMVQKYTLPFEYMWALLVMGESYDFVKGLADLAYNAEIQIGIYDQLETTVASTYEEYTEHFKDQMEKYEGSSKDSLSLVKEEITPEEEYTYYEKESRIANTNSILMDIIYADVWVAQVLTEYENTITTEERINEEENFPDEDWNIDGPHESSGERKEKTGMTDEDGDPIYRTIYWKEVTYNHTKTTGHLSQKKEEVIKNEYKRKSATVNPKVDVDESSGNNFVKLLRKDSKAFGLLTNNSVLMWLLDVLESNNDTNNMIDLTKYLIYKAKDPESEYINIDFELMYSPADYNTITTIYGNSVEEKVWYALRNAGFSEIATAGAMGNIYSESHFQPTAVEGRYDENNGGIGLCQWTNYPRNSGEGRNTNLKRYADSKGSTWKDVDIQIQFLLGELTGSGEAVEMGYAGIAFISNSMYDSRRYTKEDWENAESIGMATRAFCATFERPARDSFDKTIATRINKAQEYYDKYSGMDLEAYTNLLGTIPLTGANAQNMTNMLSRAIAIANDDPVWDANGNIISGYGYDQNRRMEEHYYDCSSFAYRLYKQFFNIDIPSSTAGYSTFGYKGEYDQSALPSKQPIPLQPGDVLLRTGKHVAIYLGNGRLVAARGKEGKRDKYGPLRGANQIEVYEVTRTESQNEYNKIYRFVN